MAFSFQNIRVAFCGEIEQNAYTRICTFLNTHSVRYTILSHSIDLLILGTNYRKRYKYTLLKDKCRCIPYDILLQSIPAIQTKLWCDLYAPRSLSNIIGHKSQIDALQTWLQTWSIATNKAVLITGPPGIGKTTTVHRLIEENGYICIELNASNERSASAVRHWFEEASHSHYVGTRRVVVMDEVDGMSSGDRGGIGELASILQNCAFPVICIANDRTPKLNPLMKCCLDIRFARPTRTTIAKSLYQTVIKDQGLSITIPDLELLCERNGNDIRSILNFLQFDSRSSTQIRMTATKDDIHRIDAFSATGRLFGNTGTMDDRMNYVFVDFSLVPLMVAEGYLGAAARGPGTENDRLQRCILAADYLGMWDILDTRVRKTQNWSMLPNTVMSIVSASYSVEGPAPFQIFPSWLGKQSRRMKHMRNMRDLCRRSGFSTNMALLETVDMFRTYLYDATCSIPTILKRLDEYGLTRDDMFETLADTVFKGSESSVEIDSKRKSAITREWKRMHSHKDMTVKDTIQYDSDNDEIEIEEYL